MRGSAATALGSIGPAARTAVPGLIEILKKDGDHFNRAFAAAALGRIGAGSRPAIPALRQAADNDPDPSVRNLAVTSMKLIELSQPTTRPTTTRSAAP